MGICDVFQAYCTQSIKHASLCLIIIPPFPNIPYTGHTYMENSCFQKNFWFIIYSCNKESVALTAVGTSKIELKERLVPHHIKTAGFHGHEPNRLCLLSSTYKCQIRPLESGFRLLTWQIRGGFRGGGGLHFQLRRIHTSEAQNSARCVGF